MPPKDVQSRVPQLFVHRPRAAPRMVRAIVSTSRTPRLLLAQPTESAHRSRGLVTHEALLL
eukprot:1879624-Amphidinium_carterae.1